MKTKTAFIIGKFYPLHKGHLSLIQFGINQIENKTIDKLIILVDNHTSYNISLKERMKMIRDSFPHSAIEIRGIKESTFQEPEESENFWSYWFDIIKKYIPEKNLSYIIGSMEYIKDIAKILKIDYLMIDPERYGIDFSARKFRKEPLKYWDYLAPSSKAYFQKSIAILGPESAGKSTLCQNLAKHYDTSYTPEYARTFIEHHHRDLKENDFLTIQKNHFAHHTSLLKLSKLLHFSDTEAITTKVWFNYFFPKRNDDFLKEYIAKQNIDLFLLLKPQKDWQLDKVRYQKDFEIRLLFFEKLKEELIRQNVNFVIIENTKFNNLNQSIIEIEKFLKLEDIDE